MSLTSFATFATRASTRSHLERGRRGGRLGPRTRNRPCSRRGSQRRKVLDPYQDATLRQVDREQLFFLIARGLSRQEAERLIVRGLFQDVLDRIALEPVREALGAALEARIPQAESSTLVLGLAKFHSK